MKKGFVLALLVLLSTAAHAQVAAESGGGGYDGSQLEAPLTAQQRQAIQAAIDRNRQALETAGKRTIHPAASTSSKPRAKPFQPPDGSCCSSNSMEEAKRILDQLKCAYEGEAWHGPSLREILADVTAEQAAAHPLPNAHSIWELVLHIAAWENAAQKVLEGLPINVPPEVNFPPIPDTSESAWQDALATLETGHHGLREAIDRLTDADLDTAVGNKNTGRRYSVYCLLHGVVQHDLYHAGQIVMLKKALAKT